MSEITGNAVAHEAYAFCCMRCGHGWEQAYDIEHHTDASGQQYVVYKADGLRVPSPLSSPTCLNCGHHVVRIMRSGQVSSVHAYSLMNQQRNSVKAPRTPRQPKARKTPKAAKETAPAKPVPVTDEAGGAAVGAVAERARAKAEHHWHLSDLLHPFHRK
ncbi:hypothetical protein [Streptomyces sp. NP-1717]|uniref:hypothetical protein n=1 Tax=unclassified Streptomyces TaxID=2593676 RepID=UPI001F5C8729|nr:hypothetical protein [Streptomyces sp. NP-1717]MCI3222544.1 hypothetical protein [Streptomyces sp. NP-1717]WTA73817.1 hypothetical protein OG705_13540 [Streptomyces sp. NBC_00838]